MQHILCPQDMIILVIERIRNTDQDGGEDFKNVRWSSRVLSRQKWGTKGFQQAINASYGPSSCNEKVHTKQRIMATEQTGRG